MVRSCTFLIAAILAASNAFPVSHAGPLPAPQARTASTSVPIMPLSEVKPGMKGTVSTVFRGDRIEQFGFEVLGTLDSVFGPKEDVILVRLTGEKPEYTGVVAGMSGSPAVIDGRLIGALSLRIGVFTKEPIAGITPIESMLPVLEYGKSPRPGGVGGSPAGNEMSTGQQFPGLSTRLSTRDKPLNHAPMVLEPIPTPLFFSGFSRDVVEHFTPMFEQYHLVPMVAGGGGADSLRFNPDNTDAFVPGGAVSAVLVAGDQSIYATGTISYRDGNRVLAFGHPFFQMGGIEMPMAQASVITTLASEFNSFKIARVGEMVGTVTQDRLTAIMGQIGVKPDMIRLNVRITSPSRGEIPLRYEIMQHPALTPLLIGLTLSGSVFGSLDQSDELTLDYSGTIRVEGFPDVPLRDSFSASDRSFFLPVINQAAGQISRIFSLIYSNEHDRPKIRDIEVTFKLSEGRRDAVLEELQVAREEVRPGETLEVRARIRPYRGEPVIRTIQLKIPESVKPGERLNLMACDASSIRTLEEREVAGTAGSLEALITVLSRERTNDRLYVRLAESSPGYAIDNRLFPSLPLSVLSIIDSARRETRASKVTDNVLVLDSVGVGYNLTGNRVLTLTVD